MFQSIPSGEYSNGNRLSYPMINSRETSLSFLSTLTVLFINTIAPSQLLAAPVNSAGEEKISQQLVLRILKCPSDCLKEMKLLIGRLPEKLPVDLPLPSNAKVIATLVRNQKHAEVILDATQSPDQIRAFYKAQLQAAGWKNPRSYSHFNSERPGFIVSDSTDNLPLYFCKSAQGPGLSIASGRGSSNAPTDVRLYLDNGSDICQEPQAQQTTEPNEQLPLPSLVAPSSIQVSNATSIGGDGYGENFYASAHLESQLSAAAIQAAYEEQLTRSGWTKLSTHKDESILWSSWKLKGKQGQYLNALLTFTPNENKANQYTGTIVVIKQ
ncbi:MAG: hypothetical protein KME13_01565 [Myxacorys californica WJT36-NPBG1]|jgi:hypothetical protein|nr:hypothetical protein [Myxacorys californica WJT36-NPBG1]